MGGLDPASWAIAGLLIGATVVACLHALASRIRRDCAEQDLVVESARLKREYAERLQRLQSANEDLALELVDERRAA